ncbi:MAG: hypothetical protein ACRDTE_15190 [Pseudonocardiaceae bacterium]
MNASLQDRADALWRAVTYVSVAALHLVANPLLSDPIEAADVKARPAGHWGTVPGTAWALTHIALAAGTRPDLRVVPILGAAHSGVAQLAWAWTTGTLAKIETRFTPDRDGLAALVAAWPDLDGLGSEVHPRLPAGSYVGGWLGGALAFAQGASLGTPGQVVVPVLGDGECETPTTAASWLAHQSLPDAHVLLIVHLNGYRMGGPSLLATMTDDQLRDYATGLGWTPVVAGVVTGSAAEHAAFHHEVTAGLDVAHRRGRRVIFLRCVKGWSGPIAAHKTPLTDLARDRDQRARLHDWLASYRPHELFDQHGHPTGALTEALETIRVDDLSLRAAAAVPPEPRTGPGFAAAITTVLRAHSRTGGLKVFSPDELASNRLGELAGEPWVHELLAEEVLLGWLAGWTGAGGRGVLVSYEAFAPLLLTSLVGLLKQRRLVAAALPSINLLLTSYGWHNVYTHGDPSLITALLASGDPAVHVYTPADSARAGVALDDALRSTGLLNVILAGKHTTTAHPLAALDDERKWGFAMWPHLGTAEGETDLSLVCVGDLPAAYAPEVAAALDRRGRRTRVINIHEMGALASPTLRDTLADPAPVLVVTLGHPAAIWGLLAGQVRQPTTVIGWLEPPHPMPQRDLAAYAGLTVDGIISAALDLLDSQRQ